MYTQRQYNNTMYCIYTCIVNKAVHLLNLHLYFVLKFVMAYFFFEILFCYKIQSMAEYFKAAL